MSANIYIGQRDLQRLNVNMKQFEIEVMATAKKALSALGMRIIAQAKANLRRRKNIATGLLVNSGAVKEDGPVAIKAGFPTMYAYYVEFGRRAGKWPPFDEILQWVKKRRIAKLHNREERKALGVTKLQDYITETYTTAFLIQRSIGKKGTRPHPFLRPAFETNKHLVVSIIRKAMRKVMTKDYTK